MLVPEPQVYEVSFTCTRLQHVTCSDHRGLKSICGWVGPVILAASANGSGNGPVCTEMSPHMQHRRPRLQVKTWCEGR